MRYEDLGKGRGKMGKGGEGGGVVGFRKDGQEMITIGIFNGSPLYPL